MLLQLSLIFFFSSLYKAFVEQHLNDFIEIHFVNSTTTTVQMNTAVLGFAKEIPKTYEVPSFWGA